MTDHAPAAIERLSKNGYLNKHLSVSRLKLYEQCPRAFKYRYVDGNRSDSGEAAAFGSHLHDVLERLFMWAVEDEFVGRLPEDRMLELYREGWPTAGLSGQSLYEEGLTILRQYLRVNGDIDAYNVLAVEHEFNVYVGPFLCNGKMDRVDKVDEQTIRIIDYKSNRMLFTKDELADDLQMSTYFMVAFEIWPWAKKIELQFHMLRHNTKQVAVRTRDQIPAIRDYLIALGTATETDTEWKAKLSPLCGYCDAAPTCVDYLQVLDGSHSIEKASLEDIDAIVLERAQVATVAGIAYRRRDTLDKYIKAKLAAEGDYSGPGYAVRHISWDETVYRDAARLRAVFKRAGVDETRIAEMFAIDQKAVERLIVACVADLPTSKRMLFEAEVQACADRVPATGRLDVKLDKPARLAEGGDAPIEKASPTYNTCPDPECKAPQFHAPGSGYTCKNGHGYGTPNGPEASAAPLLPGLVVDAPRARKSRSKAASAPDASSGPPLEDATGTAPARRGRGRPPGAKNKPKTTSAPT